MESCSKVLLETNIPDKVLFSRGKVRDIYIIPGWHRTNDEETLLMVTTDRISAFNVVMREGVPELGKIRNQISLFWANKLNVCPNHIFEQDQEICAGTIKVKYRGPNDLMGRSVLVHRVAMFPVEFIVRGYLAGSAWEAYRKNKRICGVKLPDGLRESERLPGPIFTPTTKSKVGHDKPLTFDKLVKMVGGEAAERLREITIKIYSAADQFANSRGIIIADIKLEFGMRNGRIVLADELLTPDSSRFWVKEGYRPGKAQSSFDKQPLRDWLAFAGWDRISPPPALTEEVIQDTRARYIEAYQRLVGSPWPPSFS